HRHADVADTVGNRFDAVARQSRNRCVCTGRDIDVAVAVYLRVDAVMAASYIAGLAYRDVAAVGAIEILRCDAAEAGAGAGDVSRSVDQDAAYAGGALLGVDAAAG